MSQRCSPWAVGMQWTLASLSLFWLLFPRISCQQSKQGISSIHPLVSSQCYTPSSFACKQRRTGCETTHAGQHSTIISPKIHREGKTTGPREHTDPCTQADALQLDCFSRSTDYPAVIYPSLHSSDCLLTVSTCLLSCPWSRRQLAKLPAHAPNSLGIKQLLLKLISSTATLCHEMV